LNFPTYYRNADYWTSSLLYYRFTKRTAQRACQRASCKRSSFKI